MWHHQEYFPLCQNTLKQPCLESVPNWLFWIYLHKIQWICIIFHFFFLFGDVLSLIFALIFLYIFLFICMLMWIILQYLLKNFWLKFWNWSVDMCSSPLPHKNQKGNKKSQAFVKLGPCHTKQKYVFLGYICRIIGPNKTFMLIAE